MSHDELKAKGNECIKQKKYQAAVTHYTDALTIDSNSFAVYSNRSLAYSKLQKFNEALEDAEKCIALSPSFARGYLRKAVACNALNKLDDAMESAQTGYKLRSSETICRDCIGQWLEANQKVYRPLVERHVEEMGVSMEIIPQWCRIVSNETWTIVLNILLCRLEYTSTGVPVEFMISCIGTIFKELQQILALFGHKMSSATSNWLQALRAASIVNPTVQRVPETVTDTLLDETKATVSWLDTDVDHLLYSIISPLVGIAILAIMCRCISLNVLCSEQSVNIAYCRACILFFGGMSVLSGKEFIPLLLGIYKELLEAYGTSAYKFTKKDWIYGISKSILQLPNH